MPHAAEFEEKEYEIALYMELARSTQGIWTPGQVLENKTGYEAAVRASNDYWKHVGRGRKPGVTLQGAALGLPRGTTLSVHGATPSFKANLFVQAKRCTRYARGPRALRKVVGRNRPDPKKAM